MTDDEKNDDYITRLRDDLNYFTSKASELVRISSIAGIAVVWIFRTTERGTEGIPQELYVPLLLFVLTLLFDLMHYTIAGSIWMYLYNKKESELKISRAEESRKFVRGHNKKWLWPHTSMYYGKMLSLSVGYFYLVIYLTITWVL